MEIKRKKKNISWSFQLVSLPLSVCLCPSLSLFQLTGFAKFCSLLHKVAELRILLARGRLCCLHALHVFGEGADYSCHSIEGADIDVAIGQPAKRREKNKI